MALKYNSATKDTVSFSSRSCDRCLCGNNHYTCKNTCTTLNYCVVPAWITRRSLKSRGTCSSLLAGYNEILRRGAGPLIPEQREREPGRDALNLQVRGHQRHLSSHKPLF
ncbi:hypothetical protein TNCV_603211 [Trichonephila clavipes]|nr:hypothetical protein TNCV_603211 [Trichonephila clavipes]